MKNRKLLLIVSLVLALTMSLGGTLAYLQDTDEAVNVMTLGNVDIEQYEEDAEGNPFEQGQPLYPAYVDADNNITGAIDKVVNVKNVGSSEAYVRTLLAFEAGTLNKTDFEKYIHTVFAEGAKVEWLPSAIEAKGVKYYVACVDYGAVAAGVETDPSLLKVYMDKTATNETVAEFGETYEIIALSQAIQTTNMPDAATAWTESFGAFNAANAAEWFNGVSVIPVTTVSTAAELKEALAAGGTVMLADNIDLGKEMLTVPADTAVTLELNGHDLTTDLSGNGDAHTAMITVNKGASLTINGNGDVHVTANKTQTKVSAIINNDAGNVTINGGNYTMDYGTYDEGYLIPTIVDNNSNVGNATLTINGGTFTHDRNMFRNFSNAAGHNNYQTVAKIVINDGTFLADGDGSASIWNQKPSSTTPAGAGAVEINGGTFVGVTVYDDWTEASEVPSGDNVTVDLEGKVVSNKAELLALSAKSVAGNIYITDDIDMNGEEFSAIIAPRGKKLIINGNGNIISNVKIVSGVDDNTTGQASMFYAYTGSTLEVSNLTLMNVTVNADANASGYAAAVVGYCEGNAILNNVDVVNAKVTGVKSSGMMVGHLSGTLTATDCNMSGTVTLADFAEETEGHYAGKYVGTVAGVATLTDCTADVTVSGNLKESNIGDDYGRLVSGSLTKN